MTPDLDQFTEWIGRTESDVDYVTIPSVHRLSATLDRDDPKPRIGDPLPIGWHSILFPRVLRQSHIGVDGHPKRGDFLPPVPLPRRMFAGKRITFRAPLKVGDEVRRQSTIQSVTPKQGRTGQMVFVTVKTDIHSPREIAITEEQDIVYRGEPDRNATAPAPSRPAGESCMEPLADTGSRSVVPVLGADLQRSPHPLRLPVCNAGRRVSKPRDEWRAHDAARVRTRAHACIDAAALHLIPQRAAAFRRPRAHALWRALCG
ncbi:MAG: FAS1-like dehydratase domain-containing protein [Burkholderiales bacterium]